MQIKQVAVVLAALSITAHVAAKPPQFPEPIKRLTTQIKYCLVSSHLPRLYYERIRCGILTDKRSYIQEDLKQLRAIAGKDGLRYAAEALVLADQQGLKQAIAYLSAAHEVNRNPSVVGGTLSVLYHLDGQDDLAVTTAEGISKRFPEEKRALRVLSEIYTNRKEYEKAYKVLAVLYPLAPSDPYLLGDASLHLLIADVCKHLGHLTQRASYLELACWKQVDLELWLASFDALVNDRVDYYSAYIRAGELYRLFGDDVRVLKRAALALSWVSMPSAISLQMQVVEQQPTAENRELLAKYEAQNDAFFVRQNREQVLAEFEYKADNINAAKAHLVALNTLISQAPANDEPALLLRKVQHLLELGDKTAAIDTYRKLVNHRSATWERLVAKYEFSEGDPLVLSDLLERAWEHHRDSPGLMRYYVKHLSEKATVKSADEINRCFMEQISANVLLYPNLSGEFYWPALWATSKPLEQESIFKVANEMAFLFPLQNSPTRDALTPTSAVAICDMGVASRSPSIELIGSYLSDPMQCDGILPLLFRRAILTGDYEFLRHTVRRSGHNGFDKDIINEMAEQVAIGSINAFSRLSRIDTAFRWEILHDPTNRTTPFTLASSNKLDLARHSLMNVKSDALTNKNPLLKELYILGEYYLHQVLSDMKAYSPTLVAKVESERFLRIQEALKALDRGDRKLAVAQLSRIKKDVTSRSRVFDLEFAWIVDHHSRMTNRELVLLLWGNQVNRWWGREDASEVANPLDFGPFIIR